MTEEDVRRLSRRTVLGAAAATGVAVAAFSSLNHLDLESSAQVASPVPSTPVPSSGDSSEVTLSQDMVPPTELGPAVPPEFTSDPTNWPTEHGNLKRTRGGQLDDHQQ